MLYCKPWTVFGDNIKGLNFKCDDDGSVTFLSDKSYGLYGSTDEWRIYNLTISGSFYFFYKRV